MLEALIEANLRLKPKKYEFYRIEVEFLGYIVSTTSV
jgi:hypothetical protein